MTFGPPEYESSPLRGLDFSWMAVDRDGHLAWLVTFGSAVVPPWVERDADALDDIEASLLALPERGGVDVNDSSLVGGWVNAAKRGIFGYDWRVYTGPYDRVARPLNPLLVGDLPQSLIKIAERTQFDHVCFEHCVVLHVADVVASKERARAQDRGAP